MEIVGIFLAWGSGPSYWSVRAHILRSAVAWVTLWQGNVSEENFQYLYNLFQIINYFPIFCVTLFSSSGRGFGEERGFQWSHLHPIQSLAPKTYAPKHLLRGTFDRLEKEQV